MSEHIDHSFDLLLTASATAEAARRHLQFETSRVALDALAQRVGIADALSTDVRVVLDCESRPHKPTTLDVDQPLYGEHDVVVRSELDEDSITVGVADRLFKHPVLNPTVAHWYRTQARLESLSYRGLLGGIVMTVCSLPVNEINDTAGFISITTAMSLMIAGGAAHIASGVRSMLHEPQRPTINGLRAPVGVKRTTTQSDN